MALTYLLACGNCGVDNYIDMNISSTTIYWVCGTCGNESITSLATTPSGELITDFRKSKAIVEEKKVPKSAKKVKPKEKSVNDGVV